MKKIILITILFIILSLMTVVGGAAFAQTGTETRITYDLNDQFDPKISGNIIVYTDRRHGDADIFYYNIATGVETQLTSGGGDQLFNEIDGNRIVYTDYGAGNADVWVYDISTGVFTRLTSDPANQRRPSISGDLVVYEDDRNGDWDIYLFDLKTMTERRLTDDPAEQRRPSISGTKVVWEDTRWGNTDVYMMDASDNTVIQVTDDLQQDTAPHIDGDIIAFTSNRDNPGDIYYYRISTGETMQVSDTPDLERNPHVSGDYISYDSYANGNGDIWLYRISRGVAIQVTTAPTDQYLNDLSGHRVVYTYNDSVAPYGQLDIYMYEFSDFGPEPDIDVSPLTYSFGDVKVGTMATTIVTVTNNGTFDLALTDVRIVGSGPYWFKLGGPMNQIPPGGFGEIYVYYTPNVLGPSTGTLQIYSDDPDENPVEVQLSGNAVAAENPSEQVAYILTFFDESVASGTLVGSGSGNSARGRLNALRNMIEAAGDLIRNGQIQEAIQQLQDAYQRVDGLPRPPDFATGPAAAELARLILQLISSLRG